MIQVICRDQKISYSAYHLVKAFWPETEVRLETDACLPERIRVSGVWTEELLPEAAISAEDIPVLYQKLQELTGQNLPWGMLTGVRPVKLATQWMEEHPGKMYAPEAEEEFVSWFHQERQVSREKAVMAFRIARKEQDLLREISAVPASLTVPVHHIPGFSLYVGIPFCPSICSYCSFSSGDIGRYQNLVEDYLYALFREMQQKAEIQKYVFPATVYIGGGTPTSLSAEQLNELLNRMDRIWRIPEGRKQGSVREYTVEAGRPDSITKEKLQVLKDHAVNRISINPQSMQQKTLDRIGRRHTVEQVRQTFQLAREMGFDNINMDLIMGLPGETVADVQDTLRQIRCLNPDSLTVHSLAIKRASAMGIARSRASSGNKEEHTVWKSADGADAAVIGQMISDAHDAAAYMGMDPYYLYRQKSIAGNFENIGYAKPGREGLYNVLIMEEVQTILACGAGASTKIVTEEGVPNPARKGQITYMTRSENVKNIEAYIRNYSASEESAAVQEI